MRITKRHLISFFIAILISFFLVTYQLPYYIYKPGGAEPLDYIVEVDRGFTSEGAMHLVTVSGGQATPIQFLQAMFSSHRDILPLEDVRPKGMTDEEYMHAQLQMMESSQESSTVVAYEAADQDISIDYNGVFVVAVIDKMPSEGKLKMGDRIVKIDGEKVDEADDLINYINQKEENDSVKIEFYRDEVLMTENLLLQSFKDSDKVGIGIQLVTNRDVKVDPNISFSSGNIGGPSAGLMFALEIYNQLSEEDLTKGYEVIGTGEVDYNGNILRIGGVDKKVVAADRAGCHIFFVPYENGAADSNYEKAKQTAKQINTDMDIVPVDTFEEALSYLQDLKSFNGQN